MKSGSGSESREKARGVVAELNLEQGDASKNVQTTKVAKDVAE